MVRAKKHLGQHFLKDDNIANRIVRALSEMPVEGAILEIGPGIGVLTQFLLKEYTDRLYLIELDSESVEYLSMHYPKLASRTFSSDFLRDDLSFLESEKFSIIGNFPYNISSQIFFKVLEMKDRVDYVVGMLQYEVAKRLASPSGNKDYGILSVLLQAYYEVDYLFAVEAHVFNPPPKVRSGVIRLKRKSNHSLDCDEVLFKKVVKQGFQNRRKTLRNALKPLNLPAEILASSTLDRRAETLGYEEFVILTQQIDQWKK